MEGVIFIFVQCFYWRGLLWRRVILKFLTVSLCPPPPPTFLTTLIKTQSSNLIIWDHQLLLPDQVLLKYLILWDSHLLLLPDQVAFLCPHHYRVQFHQHLENHHHQITAILTITFTITQPWFTFCAAASVQYSSWHPPSSPSPSKSSSRNHNYINHNSWSLLYDHLTPLALPVLFVWRQRKVLVPIVLQNLG